MLLREHQDTTAPSRRLGPVTAAFATLGAALAGAGMVLIWAARLSIDQVVYVSGLGAPSMPTATIFNGALLSVGVGGALAALSCRGLRSTNRMLGIITVATTLFVAGCSFVVASFFTCTDGCPIPFTPGSTLQDLAHITAAATGFAAAAGAMLQVATAPGARAMRRGASVAAVATASSAAAGATLSLVGVRTDIGAMLEFVAMTVAILWLVGFAIGNVVSGLGRDIQRRRS